MLKRKQSIYEKYIKRLLDILCALLAILILSLLFLFISVIVRIKMGSPIIFKQLRPGLIGKDGKEKIFRMYKFRSMTDKRNENGELLPDSERLPKFGKILRATSLDELPELFNILKGDMSFVGPRPQLVRDMVFMNETIRKRHTAKPGLSGLAQVNGRNAVTWEQKFKLDLQYIEKISFTKDLKIIGLTIKKVFGREESEEELDVTDDYGDWLLKTGKIDQKEYDMLQAQARSILDSFGRKQHGKI